MSTALALYYFSRSLDGVRALPLSEIDGRERARSTSPCNDLNNCRTTSDIIWSCLTTIFACTWVAIHPNIPAPYESLFEIGLRRLGIVIMALIAPELVILWAMKQWIISRRLAKEHHAEGWTQTHGFFALMGGFMLCSGDKALYTLTPEKLDELSKDGKIAFPKITREEIEDKSKGDIISKGFVIIQTSWFVIQCVARGVEILAITELELVTLAFAVLNLATYSLWWNKPLNVQRPISVRLARENTHQVDDEEEIPGMFKRTTQSMIECWRKGSVLLPILPFMSMVFGDHDDVWVARAKKVPSFYSGGRDDEKLTAAFVSAAIAVIFGALHCIAWSFQFPSHEKQIIWRTCSLIITCLPVTLVVLGLLAAVMDDHSDGRIGIAACVSSTLGTGLTIMVTLIIPMIYIAARVILIVEAFTLLNSLPPGAFQTVQWTRFIPHV
ncbi:hypothetical protein BD410DRAFT_775534 [Rickenella mellea]|uniref:Uncharacterized protein n=1 Tax=Rickenella mellea TaxID=50990 RepID=A0A4Y7PS68_9AGAM|nr:hypothetical protein BD410DRAFT_775534 [Rickenella mellea]